MSYKIIGHTADLRMNVEGKTPENLFSEALAGMAHILKNKIKNEKVSIKREIIIESSDLTALLVDFLSEILSLTQINKEIYTKVNFKKFNSNHIEAELEGIDVDFFDSDIKAVTYHEAEVKQDKDGFWKTILVFDI